MKCLYGLFHWYFYHFFQLTTKRQKIEELYGILEILIYLISVLFSIFAHQLFIVSSILFFHATQGWKIVYASLLDPNLLFCHVKGNIIRNTVFLVYEDNYLVCSNGFSQWIESHRASCRQITWSQLSRHSVA